MCLIEEGEGHWEFSHSKVQVARKEHSCDECGRAIACGEKYEAFCGKWDGDLVTSRTCLYCVAARRWLVEECGGWCYGAVLEDLAEHWEGMASLDLGRRIVGMRKQWRGRMGERFLAAIASGREAAEAR